MQTGKDRPVATPLRADARRNRAKLLEAAEKVLAAKGPAASTDEIAKAAGVGIGTLFRHFPTKEALIEGVLAARLRRMADEATRLATTADGLEVFLRHAVEQAEVKNALAGLLASAGVDPGVAADGVRDDLTTALDALLRNAQDSGAVRRDLRVADLIGLLAGASRAVEYARADPSARERILSVIVDGLRPGPAAAVPGPAAAVPDPAAAVPDPAAAVPDPAAAASTTTPVAPGSAPGSGSSTRSTTSRPTT
jgi:AcrR family transcriptional regulator